MLRCTGVLDSFCKPSLKFAAVFQLAVTNGFVNQLDAGECLGDRVWVAGLMNQRRAASLINVGVELDTGKLSGPCSEDDAEQKVGANRGWFDAVGTVAGLGNEQLFLAAILEVADHLLSLSWQGQRCDEGAGEQLWL